MFGEGTPFDLQLHLVRIPVRVIPTFWLMAAVLGWDPDRLDLVFLWVLCVFGSVLFHELGHALTAAAFGYDPHIVLYHFGGYAAFFPDRELTPLKSLLITLAGPLPQLALGFAVLAGWFAGYQWAAERLEPRYAEYLQNTLTYLCIINIGWALMNLLPVLPLDGGQAMQAVFAGLGLRDPQGWAMKLSVFFGALATAGLYHFGGGTTALLFLMLTVQNVQALQQRRW
ncbi:MAG TPA: site-2 protease family protein [Planctomycetaceae bacterium]|nr:site-2 protease family protein [Planctomycetaceae bacterium]